VTPVFSANKLSTVTRRGDVSMAVATPTDLSRVRRKRKTYL